MRFSLTAAIFLALNTVLPTSWALDHDIAGGALLVETDRNAVPDTLLEPMINSPVTPTTGDQLQRREPTIIEGLLQIRQSCPTGYGLCNNGRCCPLGGKCCTKGCCDPGSWCYSSGCCLLTEMGCEGVSCCPVGSNCCKGGGCCKSNYYCVVTPSKGCCPIGKICNGTVKKCNDPNYDLCPNDDFCCPPGDTCYRDNNNTPRCRGSSSGGGGGGGGDTTPHTTPHTSTTPQATTTPNLPDPPEITPTSTQPDSTSSSSKFGTPTQSLSTARPTVLPNQVSFTYTVSDSKFTWIGSGWNIASSSCSGSSKRTNTPMQSFTLIVPSATRIWLNVDCLNVEYDVYINGQRTSFTSDISQITEVCVYKEAPLGISTKNVNITVVVIGMPLSGITKRQNTWSFQLNEVMAVDSSSSASSTSAVTPLQTTANGATGLEANWFPGVAAVLLAGFGLAL
ncbi:hypothetical protein P691DRAFT_496554 [Macrolepiota fuliginosa MF-IS2]|uniref:GPI anchored protein n=1 Tax=Macrolepiota fuliginosa MF-IS2 TaxID=1400762 RepID=A0A9P5XH43_9AGAR|nr:hypothetical protein P691DRAFT_496554 [Macrolepiota fuliginosa MF-IS2]